MKHTEKERIVNKVAYQIQESGYKIRKPNELFFVAIAPDESQETVVFVHTERTPLRAVKQIELQAELSGRNSTHILYGDGETFFRKIAYHDPIAFRGSLKRYAERSDSLYELVKLERFVASRTGGRLAYFHPKDVPVAGSSERLTLYDSHRAILDYSHLPPDDPAQRSHGLPSKSFRVLEERVIPDNSKLQLVGNQIIQK